MYVSIWCLNWNSYWLTNKENYIIKQNSSQHLFLLPVASPIVSIIQIQKSSIRRAKKTSPELSLSQRYIPSEVASLLSKNTYNSVIIQGKNAYHHIWLVPDSTVNKRNNNPPFGTQGSLTFDLAIDPYTLPFLFLMFSILLYRYNHVQGQARGTDLSTNQMLVIESPGSSGPRHCSIRGLPLKDMGLDRLYNLHREIWEMF